MFKLELHNLTELGEINRYLKGVLIDFITPSVFVDKKLGKKDRLLSDLTLF